jgi:hypothetical protein
MELEDGELHITAIRIRKGMHTKNSYGARRSRPSGATDIVLIGFEHWHSGKGPQGNHIYQSLWQVRDSEQPGDARGLVNTVTCTTVYILA